MPDFADAMTTSTTPSTTTWSPFTTVAPADETCSLITTRPPGIAIVWFGEPVGTMGIPLINGIPIVPTGSPNQTIAIPGGRVVINEQVSSAGATVVNGLHVVVEGVVDVVIASAKSGI